jgi:tetratricopeptide (TPR) repeat protein
MVHIQIIFLRLSKGRTMRRYTLTLMLALALCIPGCMVTDITPKVALREDLSDFHREATTSSELAQKYFDQGLTLYYGFNHDAAIGMFTQAAELDSNFAMAYWGCAISAGPHINNPMMDSAAAIAAFEAVTRAASLESSCSQVERALILALQERYAWPAPENRATLDSAYADAMRDVYRRFPQDADVAALFADAMMNLRPWDLWTPDGVPQPGTPEIIAAIEAALKIAPDHPGACHFYVHTMEASPDPGKALRAANVLRDRIPGAGHLVHMPSHIDIRLGHYADAIEANRRGIAVDSTWMHQGGFYTIYRAHNYHFLAYAAMFDGQKDVALTAARGIEATVPMELVLAFPDYLDAFIAIPIHVMVRFGMWEDIIAEPRPADDLPASIAFWHYGRTVAFAALGRVAEAEKEFAALKTAYAAVPESRLLGNNTARTVLEVGLPMAEGELEYRKKNYAKAFSLLRTAIRRDDALRYDEPWGWMMPVRHSLGALLLEQGKAKEAEAVYREDLRLHPDNGWALQGLAECLHRTERHDEAMAADAQFQKAWSRSDITIKASCFCRVN